MQGYIDKRSWGIYPGTFCHPLLTILVIPFMLSGCMGMEPIDRSYEGRRLGSGAIFTVPIPLINTELDLDLAVTF